VAVGAPDPKLLGIPGEQLPGVYPALPFLLSVNAGPDGLIGRKGRKVVVIGGGDVAFDAARSSLRLAKDGRVTIIYRKTREALPAGAEEVAEADEEGIQYLYERAPVRILGTGQVEAVVVQRTELGPPDASGRRTSVLVPGTEETIPCDTLIVAVGEKANLEGFPSEIDFRLSAQGWPEGRREGWMTDVDGVFATGGKSIVYAMAAGTAAAEAIDAYLQKKAGAPPTPRPDPFGGATPPRRLPEGYGGPTWQL